MLPPLPLSPLAPVFSRKAVPLYTAPLSNRPGLVKFTFPPKEELGPNANIPDPVKSRANDWAVAPCCVKPFNNRVPAKNPLPPMVMVLVSAKVIVPVSVPNSIPPPLGLFTTMFPSKLVPVPA